MRIERSIASTLNRSIYKRKLKAYPKTRQFAMSYTPIRLSWETDDEYAARVKKLQFQHSRKQQDRIQRDVLEPTKSERLIWPRIRDYGFVPQAKVIGYFPDFYHPKTKLVVEIDGQIHGRPDVKANDIERTKQLEAYGCKVIRFTNNEVHKDKNGVARKIKQAVDELLSNLVFQSSAQPRHLEAVLPGRSQHIAGTR